MTAPSNLATEPMVRAALEYLGYLRASCRIDLNYYIDENVIAEMYQRMETVRTGSVPPHKL
jgi:hypothetical protein